MRTFYVLVKGVNFTSRVESENPTMGFYASFYLQCDWSDLEVCLEQQLRDRRRSLGLTTRNSTCFRSSCWIVELVETEDFKHGDLGATTFEIGFIGRVLQLFRSTIVNNLFRSPTYVRLLDL